MNALLLDTIDNAKLFFDATIDRLWLVRPDQTEVEVSGIRKRVILNMYRSTLNALLPS